MKYLPDIMKMADGVTSVTPENAADRRKELLEILAREEYGYFPPVYGKTSYTAEKSEKICAGHADRIPLKVTIPCEKGDFTLPVDMIIPSDSKKHPLFLFINFGEDIYHKYFPVEEIVDRGYAVAYMYYENITTDNDDMTNGLSGMFTRPSDGTGYGKVTIWAYAISRVLDAIDGFENIDFDNVAVIGHSRLGKTALWCGANDERIKYVISNDSGCGGAAYERTKKDGSETILSMNRVFPYWFCENRKQYADKINEAPFDQHFVIGACAPRYVCTGSASLDDWADQQSEQRSCVAASGLFYLYDKETAVPRENAKVGQTLKSGHIQYHLRDGLHFLSRNDWNIYMDFIDLVIDSDKI